MQLKVSDNLRSIPINNDLSLRKMGLQHGQFIANSILNNKSYFDEWFHWSKDLLAPHDINEYLRLKLKMMQQQRCISFILSYNDHPIGMIELFAIDIHNHHAQMGYWIIPEAQGKGFMTSAAQALLIYAFNEKSLHRIMWYCQAENLKSSAIPLRLKAKQEALLKEYEFIDGQYYDVELYALLKREWQSQHEKNK